MRGYINFRELSASNRSVSLARDTLDGFELLVVTGAEWVHSRKENTPFLCRIRFFSSIVLSQYIFTEHLPKITS